MFVCLLAPVATSGLTYSPISDASANTTATAQNVTFVSAQGRETGGGAGIYAIDTDTKEVIWSHTRYAKKYFDVDPIGNDTVLFAVRAAESAGDTESYPWRAIVVNWRTGEEIARFSVPPDTHDVDFLGNGSYIVADKARQGGTERQWLAESKRRGWIDEDRERLRHRIYVYNRTRNAVTWEYNFSDHFPETAGDGIDADFTYLNDVDVVANGSAILASPREFDRVLLINRTTKETEWALGEEDDHDFLYEQHNPAVLSMNPPTVLVADSENDRVVEYRKDGEGWTRTEYHGELNWPRDADRLPNGNTLIADSGGDRVLEVTPRKRVVWEMDLNQNLYDVERLRYGDEAQGPPIHTLVDPDSLDRVEASVSPIAQVSEAFEEYYFLSGWIFPPWMTRLNFVLSHAALLLAVWGGAASGSSDDEGEIGISDDWRARPTDA